MSEQAFAFGLWLGTTLITAIAAFYASRSGLNGVRADIHYVRERMDADDRRQDQLENRVDAIGKELHGRISEQGKELSGRVDAVRNDLTQTQARVLTLEVSARNKSR